MWWFPLFLACVEDKSEPLDDSSPAAESGDSAEPCSAPAVHPDEDGDDFGDPELSGDGCDPAQGWVEDAGDCDDADAAVNPEATERCDGMDQDCDGEIDEDAADMALYYVDGDGDGYGGAELLACSGDGLVATGGDCDDGSASVSPAAAELCDGVDNDCDGEIDSGYAVPASFPTIQAAADAAPDGVTLCVAEGTYVEDLDLRDRILIVMGAGSGLTILEGTGLSRVVLASDSTLRLEGLTITGGATNIGSALYAQDGVITMVDVEISDNVSVEDDSTCYAALTMSGGNVRLTGGTHAFGLQLRAGCRRSSHRDRGLVRPGRDQRQRRRRCGHHLWHGPAGG